MLEKIRQFTDGIFGSVANSIGVSSLAFAGIALGAVIIAIVIIIAVCRASGKRKKEADVFVSVDRSVKTAEPPALKTTQKPAPKAEPVNEEKKEEAKKEEEISVFDQPAPVENKEEKAPVSNEPAPAEKIEKQEETVKAEKSDAEASVKKTKPAQPKAATKEKEDKNMNKKPAPKQEPAKAAPKPAKKVNGKWILEIKREGEYIAKLLASNGEPMLNSETYSTADGAKSGIATIIKGVETGKFVVYNTKGGEYYFKLKSAGNKLLCAGEMYKTKDGCLDAVESVKRFAATAVIIDDIVESDRYVDYVPAPVNTQAKKGVYGKWKVEQGDEGGFCAKLYASNGQLMLSTEEVKEKKTAAKAIESVKKNAAEGNFIIDRDKFGRYYYKLRNSVKSVICIGEGYDKLDGCVSAIESVRRFAAIATVEETEE